ncbi:MAG: glutamate--tRNA ligase [Chloroflexi bacterium]|nr:glutamate--tRNA ligase [Chloroflexota bacterium]
MANQVRVRYAPSPTGEPHVGNIRTALFSWLYARHTGGVFVVRIEDTDVARSVEGALEAILDALRWLGLDWDEGPEVGGPYGPYVQSQRLHLYRQAAEELVSRDHAYYCYCSPQQLQEMRQEQARLKQPPGYHRRCRSLEPAERDSLEAQGTPHVVRFKFPLEGETTFNDLIRGDVTFANETIDDFVILKSDGYPTYHLASVVDDHLMEISHVLRAEEWLPSTPRHVHLYNALGYQQPLFAHLPIILGPDRSKLSKRHGAVSVLHYRDMGYLPEAMFNFLALLGWSLDDHTEIITRDELVKHFSIERIIKSGAIFSHEKLTWMNGMYIRQLDLQDLAQRLTEVLEAALPVEVPRPISQQYVSTIAPLIQERLKTLADAPDLMDLFFLKELHYPSDSLVQKGMDRESTLEALRAALQRVEGLADWSPGPLEGVLRPLAQELEVKTGQLFGGIRVAVTGRTAAPPLFETMTVLGRNRCLFRMGAAVHALREKGNVDAGEQQA